MQYSFYTGQARNPDIIISLIVLPAEKKEYDTFMFGDDLKLHIVFQPVFPLPAG